MDSQNFHSRYNLASYYTGSEADFHSGRHEVMHVTYTMIAAVCSSVVFLKMFVLCIHHASPARLVGSRRYLTLSISAMCSNLYCQLYQPRNLIQIDSSTNEFPSTSLLTHSSSYHLTPVHESALASRYILPSMPGFYSLLISSVSSLTRTVRL